MTRANGKRGSRKAAKTEVVVVEPRKGGRRNRNGGSRRGAPVSTSVSLLPTNTQKLRLFGTDRVLHIPEARPTDGAPLIDLSITPELLPRLHHMAEAYQRIRYKKLVFKIVSMCPTTTSGGIAAAFVADPTDVLGSGANALNRVVAQNGSKVTKVWQSATIRASLSGDLLYTSTPPLGDSRLYSPGRFWLVCESRFSTPVPITVYLDWEVEVSVPSLETEAPEAGAVVLTANFYTRSSNPGFWYKDGAGGDDPRPHAPGIQFDVIYQSKSKSYIKFETVAGNYDRFILVNDPNHGVTLTAVGTDGKPIIQVTDINQWVLEKGQPLFPVPENVKLGSEFICSSKVLQDSSGPSQGQATSTQRSSSGLLSQARTGLLRQSKMPTGSEQAPTPAHLMELLMAFPQLLKEPLRSPSFEVLSDVDDV